MKVSLEGEKRSRWVPLFAALLGLAGASGARAEAPARGRLNVLSIGADDDEGPAPVAKAQRREAAKKAAAKKGAAGKAATKKAVRLAAGDGLPFPWKATDNGDEAEPDGHDVRRIAALLEEHKDGPFF